MDLQLYLRVLWRFRVVVALGVTLGIALAFLAYVRVDVRNGFELSYREHEEWSSSARLLVTQQGFPWGRSVADDPSVGDSEQGLRFAPPDRFASLAVLYAQLARSDEVRRLMLRDGPVRGTIAAAPAVGLQNGPVLPIVDILATSTTPAFALDTSRRTIAAIREYITSQQRTNRIPEAERVVVQVLQAPTKAQLTRSRPLTLPLVVFLAAAVVTVAFAFVLENLRPSIRSLPGAQGEQHEGDLVRRTA